MQFLTKVFFFLSLFLDGQSDVEVHLVVRKYVEKGSSVTLHCEHNVPEKILYKVRRILYNAIGAMFEIQCTNSCFLDYINRSHG